MLYPKKLNVVLDSEILEEISRELNIDIKDVKNTYKIWLDYLDYISNETSQCTVSFPKLGEMYISLVKMRRNMRTKRLKAYKEMKSKEIDLLRDKCKYIVHEKSVPVILKYGVSKRKYSKEILKEKPPFYTQRELADLQNKAFFEEDRDFSENEKIKKLFIEND